MVTDFVYEDEIVIAFMDMDPINPEHVLLIPKEHYLDVDEIPDEVLSHLTIVSKKIVTALKEIFLLDGYSIMQNGGEFNDVGHYHLHIFPRYKGDGFSWIYGSEKKKDAVDIVVEIRKRLETAIYTLEYKYRNENPSG
ncbi:HIT domain-containing protein [Aerococcaceae bacterium DSM 109653]|uniref:HIT domain-containing protein n=1 Tax=Fundicoccus ignavus TaxID=2664442 RepID=A0A844BKH0_9LACT|nr:HIT domain-containing protein [Fundicoccus ignavus]